MTCIYWNKDDWTCNLWDVVAFCRTGSLATLEDVLNYTSDADCYTEDKGRK